VEALGDLLPQEILAQRKHTFTLPWKSGCAGRCARGWKQALPILRRRWRLISSGKRSLGLDGFSCRENHVVAPWSLYVLNEWCRRHLAA